MNLSPSQFKDKDLVSNVRSALTASGLAADRLELEITESVLLHDSDAVLEILGEIKAMGVQIAMDDFGTGYSSLSYLRASRSTRSRLTGASSGTCRRTRTPLPSSGRLSALA